MYSSNHSSHSKDSNDHKHGMITRYLLAVLFILLVSSRQMSDYFATMMESSEMSSSTAQLVYSIMAVALFSLFYYLSCDHHERENFFFVPTPRDDRVLGRNEPREAVFDSNKGVTFDFSTVGSGMCNEHGCNDYGLIKGCPGKNHLYGDGSISNFM
jgi:hypothetical protein